MAVKQECDFCGELTTIVCHICENPICKSCRTKCAVCDEWFCTNCESSEVNICENCIE